MNAASVREIALDDMFLRCAISIPRSRSVDHRPRKMLHEVKPTMPPASVHHRQRRVIPNARVWRGEGLAVTSIVTVPVLSGSGVRGKIDFTPAPDVGINDVGAGRRWRIDR